MKHNPFVFCPPWNSIITQLFRKMLTKYFFHINVLIGLCFFVHSFQISHGDIRLSSTHLLMDSQVVIAGAAVFTTIGGVLYLSGSEEREKKRQYAEWDATAKEMEAERARKAFITPKSYWTEEELKPYDGTQDEEGPILFAADGKVFNVYKGRNFYGPGGEYHIFAGRDATRLLARGKLEEETEEERSKPLTMAEKAALQGWMWTFKGKYEIVGELEGFDPKTTSTKIL